MRAYILILFIACLHGWSVSGQVPAAYNIVWNSQSKNAAESMPCGGGDIGMNVWVEGGELLIYVARSGSLNEDNALMKSGRLRIKLTPNPFNGVKFSQELHLQEGFVTVEGENNGIKATATIWADVMRPIAHIEIKASKKINVAAAYESWRYQDRVIKARENFGNSWKWAAPKNNSYKKDSIGFNNTNVLFYHHNTGHTIFDSTVLQQDMEAVKSELYDPLKDLVFGGSFAGKNFVPAGTGMGVYAGTDFKSWLLKTRASGKEHSLQLNLWDAQVAGVDTWKRSLDSLEKTGADYSNSFKLSQNWWKDFWARSFIQIDEAKTGTKDWEIGRNFQLFRYMLAINANSKWPTKFNGGLLTVDPVFTDTAMKFTPDFRNWGGGLHTAQNQRLVYFPMAKNGDWDLLQPQLEFYLRLQKNAELRSKVYWNHAGACFTEQMENFGLPNFAEYGQKRPAGFDKGLEYNAWLEYEWDTVLEFCLMMLQEKEYTGRIDNRRMLFIESCLRFFDEHYQYLAKQRGAKALDGKGKLVLYPGSAAETFKMAYNSNSTIAALRTVTQKLLSVTAVDSGNMHRNYLSGLLLRLPPTHSSQCHHHRKA